MRISRTTPLLALLGLAMIWVAPAGCGADKLPGFVDGDAGDASTLSPSLSEMDSAVGPIITDGGGVFNDGSLNVDATSCVPDAGGPGPVQRVCLAPTSNECDGNHDLVTYPANGTTGNGFDDDCDGLVDEGCACNAAGITKDCYLVPASQTSAGLPVGWCAQNSKGTVDCLKPQTEFAGTWSGQCRGAQPPFADDICANGDFNCDGKEQNSKSQDCSCKAGAVQCPTNPLVTVPYPPPSALPLEVDATSWFTNPADVANATNWKWTLSGGDCDNILPHPSFGIYKTSDGTGAPLGTQIDTLGTTGKEHGEIATSPLVGASFYPAFSLSGDYLLQGEFDLYGQHVSCQQKIQVRAPGIRAEACWDTEGQGVDLDLHMAKVDGFASCTKKGWSDTCDKQDCYYESCTQGTLPMWYPSSAPSACQGWGSQTSGACGNPRLDRDANGLSGICDASETNPNAMGGSGFCGPENINVDTPSDQSKYAVAVKYFTGDAVSKTHVNVYCNGERVLSTGYNPITSNDFPALDTSGGDDTGDMWKVAMITANVTAGGVLSCDVKPTPSQKPHVATDGSDAYCVDNTTSDTADCTKLFTPGGLAPLDADALCFH